MNKKRIFALILSIIMALGLIACDSKMPNDTEGTETTMSLDKMLGWNLNSNEPESVLPVEIEERFLTAIEVYGDTSFEPVAYIGFDESGVAHRILCQRGKEDVRVDELDISVDTETTSFEFEVSIPEFDENSVGNVDDIAVEGGIEETEIDNSDFVLSTEMDLEPEMYMVTLVNDCIVEVIDIDFDMLITMNQENSDRARIDFEAAGWKYYLKQEASEMPVDVIDALKVAPADIKPIQFIAVHRADDDTLIFTVLGRNSDELVMMFITVFVDGAAELVNMVPVT